MNRKIISPISFDESLIRKSIQFYIKGKPRGKERPRVVRLGNRITTYTPKNTVDYENEIRKSYRSSNGQVKLNNEVEADILAIFPIPKSLSKKKKEELLKGNTRYTKKPDCDNIGKVVLDALNKVAYDDDSQICKLSVEKFYGPEPMVKVKLKEL